jgi:hypothetical protein
MPLDLEPASGRVYSGYWQGLKFLPKPAPTSIMVNN